MAMFLSKLVHLTFWAYLVITVRPLGIGSQIDTFRGELCVEGIEDFGDVGLSGVQVNLAGVECRIGRRGRTEQITLQQWESTFHQMRNACGKTTILKEISCRQLRETGTPQ